MSKLINLTPELLDEIFEEFKRSLSTLKMSDGKVTYSKTFGNTSEKATLYFSEVAWMKMQTLVREFDKEVAWHGIAKRVEAEENGFIIEDILVYPQVVTGTTVNTDQEEYQTWLYELEDEQFNNLRMQGHSHVNMSTSPSSVDTAMYEEFLEQLEGSMFYIFLIWNKRNEKTIKIYDMDKNRLFETADIEVKVLDDQFGLQSFTEEAKELVKTRAYTYTPQTTVKPTSTTPAAKKDAGKEKKAKKKKVKAKEPAAAAAAKASAWYDDDDYYSPTRYGYGNYYNDYYGDANYWKKGY